MDLGEMTRMANQIAGFFRVYGHDKAVRDVADHINRFWEPHMRAALIAHLERGGEGLDRIIVDAAPLIRRPATEAA